MQKDTCCAGWTGISCNVPACTIPCDKGQCTAPDTCTCNTGYAGEACQYLESMFC